jgi:NTP pyrophosphatase (non-canonical NTP hydrolase)
MTLIDYAQVIDDLASLISHMSEGKGFWDPEDVGDMGIIPLKLALISDECGEALGVHRNEYDDSDESQLTRMTEMQEDDFTEEVADIIIRALDLVGYYNLPIGQAVTAKIAKNNERPYRHGKRY